MSLVCFRWVVCLLVLGLGSTLTHADEAYVLKFATLAPQGSTWMNIISDWAARVDRESKGRLKFRLYPGGISGDEPDVLRKIRFGQLQGGALTGHGIGYIYSPARVLEIPFMYRSYEEVDYVRERLMPELRQGFRQNDFELLGWMETGFVRVFSKVPVRSMEDLRKRRIWQWQGDQLSGALFSAAEISPVPLPITEVYTSLSTGLIDTTVAPPLGAIALQWYTRTPYMVDVNLADGIGGLLVSSKFFEKLPKDLQALLLSTGAEASSRLIAETRRDNAKSIEVLKKQGVSICMTARDIKESELIDLRDKAAVTLTRSGYIPQSIYDKAQKTLAEYRSRKETR